MAETEVIVVGGGFSGLCAAAALAETGAEVLVLEALERNASVFRGELLHPLGVRTLETLGLSEALDRAEAVAVTGFCVLSSTNGRAVSLPYRTNARLGRGFEHGAVVASFRRKVDANPRVRLVLGARVEALEMEAGRVVGVRCADGSAHRARLVIAADGRHSRLRKLVGIGTETRLLSHMAVLGVEGAVLPEPDRGHVFVGAPGPILAYHYARERVRVCLDIPTGVTRRRRKDLIAYIRHEYTPVLPPALRAAIHAGLERDALTGCANHAITLVGCAARGIALVGDAGGCTHPLTATGMTSALHDVLLLRDSVRAAGLTDAALLGYQKGRTRYVRARELFAQSLYETLRGADVASRALQEALFDYWRTSERAQRASIAILSGEHASLSSFLGEFGRVAGLAAWQATRKLAAMPRASAPSARALLAILAESTRVVCNEGRALRKVDGMCRLPAASPDQSAPRAERVPAS